MIDDGAPRRTERCLSLSEIYKRRLCRSSLTMTAEGPSADGTPTVLSTLQATLIPDDIAPSSLHYFSSSGEQTVALLHALLDTTEHLAHSVTLHSATLVNDSKAVSLLRQHSARQHTLHLVNDVLYPFVICCASSSLARVFSDHDFPPSLARRWKKSMAAAEERRHADTGYDGPSDYSSTLARISAWSSAVGMQTYPENTPDTFLLGGEVLDLDVALLPEPTVHAPYAGSAAEGHHSPAMDAFFSRLVSDVSKGGDGRRLRDAP
jgi:hypothetical protein